MTKRIIMILTVLLAITVIAAPASSGASSGGPWLSISEGKQNISHFVQNKIARPRMGYRNEDWNVKSCFRWANNAVQCRWSASFYSPSDGDSMLCYGNARAVAKFDGYVYSRTISVRCV
jgi:hypothetical protein